MAPSIKQLTALKTDSGTGVIMYRRFCCISMLRTMPENNRADSCQNAQGYYMNYLQGVAEIVKHYKILVTCFSTGLSRSAGI